MLSIINFLDVPYHWQLQSLEWRNSQTVSQYFKIKHIALETHKKWLADLLKDKPHTIAFFIKYNGIFVGVSYFHSINYSNREADWGIYIHNVKMRGRNLGKQSLDICLEYAKCMLNLKKIFLEVLSDNDRAIHLYRNAQFKCISQNDNIIRMCRILT